MVGNTLFVIYVLVITPPRVLWRVYMHEPEGAKCPEGRVHIYTP